MYYTPFALPSILSAVILLSLLVYVFLQRRNSTGSWQFMGYLVCSFFWAFGYAMSLLNQNIEIKTFWYNLAQVGPDFSPVFWLLLVLDYCGHGNLLKRKWGIGVFIIPVITTILMWTNDWHHLLRLGIIIRQLTENVSYVATLRGPWYIIEAVYGYAVILFALYQLLRFLQWSSYKKQTLVLIGAMVLPIFFNALDVFEINPLKPFGSTSIVFSLTGLILTWGFFRQRLLDLKPIARNKVLENIGDGVIVLDERNRIADVNPAACCLFDSKNEESTKFIGKDLQAVLSLWPELNEQSELVKDSKIQLALQVNKARHFFDVTISSLYESHGKFVGRVLIFHDITEEKEKNERLQLQLDEIKHLQIQLRDQAVRDPLTGCFNRRYLDETLARESSRADRDDILVGLIMLDIDYFKRVNDTYGHAVGDEVLQAVGRGLQQKVRLGDMVCRYGGEEFLIVLPGISLQAVTERANGFCRQIEELKVLAPSGEVIKITVSVGVALYPLHGNQISEVLEHVDQALYKAKHAGRNCVSVWQVTPTI